MARSCTFPVTVLTALSECSLVHPQGWQLRSHSSYFLEVSSLEHPNPL
ncbi:rCG53419 [Rattus norvegicus]|uniref:RCG53419 n=1 Tax=Rattus norvegicus TaxID=10116 RepID=A6JRE6_RAT|nr:rCG53419 [Rattus norvegicus]